MTSTTWVLGTTANRSSTEHNCRRRGTRLNSKVGLLHITLSLAVCYHLYLNDAIHTAPHGTIGLLLFSTALLLVILSIRNKTIPHDWLVSALALADTALAATALYLTNGQSNSLFLLYFVVMLIAISSPTLPLACGMSAFLIGTYGIELYLWELYDERHLLLLPILLSMASFCAYSSETTRKELVRLKAKRNKEQLDPLTQLPNRKRFFKELRAVLGEGAPHHSPLLAVLFVDLDNFKPVNDTFGHHVGDQLLIAVANRITACLRNEDVVSRYGGDEFTLMLRNLQTTEEAHHAVSRIISSFKQPFHIAGNDIRVGASVGMALQRSPYDSAEDLVRRADHAMYRMKYGQEFQAAV